MTGLKCHPIDANTLALICQRVLPHYAALLSSSELTDLSRVSITPLGEGLINGTYLVTGSEGQFVLQRLNTQVFPRPWDLIQNSATIFEFLQSQSAQGHYALALVKPLPLASGELALDLAELGFWRGLSFVPESQTLSRVSDAAQATQVGATFGHFAANLSQLNPADVKDVIIDFHNLPKRLSQLIFAVEANTYNRLEQCQPWVDIALSQSHLLLELAKIESKLPRRICHNDTKINNMLFSVTKGEPLAVIDLDTCMPGYLMYDFGDMVRAFCSPVAEDSPHLDQVQARTELILAAAKGYTQALNSVLTEDEQQSLWLGVKVMTLMLAVRFLTDYLQGDHYFSVTSAEHNLQRAANQFTLFSRLLAEDKTMKVAFANMESTH